MSTPSCAQLGQLPVTAAAPSYELPSGCLRTLNSVPQMPHRDGLRAATVDETRMRPGLLKTDLHNAILWSPIAPPSPSGRRVDVEDLEPSVEQLPDGRSGARSAFLVMVQQPGAYLLGFVAGLRPSRRGLGRGRCRLEIGSSPAVHPDTDSWPGAVRHLGAL